jgi:hypothetical protein
VADDEHQGHEHVPPKPPPHGATVPPPPLAPPSQPTVSFLAEPLAEPAAAPLAEPVVEPVVLEPAAVAVAVATAEPAVARRPGTGKTPPDRLRRMIVFAAIGGAVSVALGAYAKIHDPTGETPFVWFFSGQPEFKVWVATVAAALAVFQEWVGRRLYGKHAQGRRKPWMPQAHRLAGTLAFIVALPVAYQCLWAIGFNKIVNPLWAVHSVAGCVVFGAFVTKVLCVRNRKLPRWALPIAGGVVFASLIIAWATTSVWWWYKFGFPSF